MKTCVVAPVYRLEERKDAVRLVNYLNAGGAGAYCSVMDFEIAGYANRGTAKGSDVLLLSRLALASDIYSMYKESDCVVGFLNGKDEGVLVKLGIAFILGVPVYLYKYDMRVTFLSGENSMILGLSALKPFADVNKLLKAVMKSCVRDEKVPFAELAPVIQDMITLGGKVWEYRKTNPAGIKELLEHFRDEESALAVMPAAKDNAALVNARVYCSGPLFSPDEHREMLSVAQAFERAGNTAYLPQRDGGEPFFLDAMKSPLTGSLISRPITNIANRIVFSMDVAELLSSAYFVCNLNGRIYDEGAMVEAGMAYAAGKPIVLYINEERSVIAGGLHTVLSAVSALGRAVGSADGLTVEMARASYVRYAGKTVSYKVGNTAQKAEIYGAKWLKKFAKKTPPVNKMLGWLEGYDDKK